MARFEPKWSCTVLRSLGGWDPRNVRCSVLGTRDKFFWRIRSQRTGDNGLGALLATKRDRAVRWDAWAISHQRRSCGDVGHDSVSTANTSHTHTRTRATRPRTLGAKTLQTPRGRSECFRFAPLFFKGRTTHGATLPASTRFLTTTYDKYPPVCVRGQNSYEKRRTDKVQREKGSKRKTTEEGHRGKTKTARRNNVFSPFVVIGEEGCFCVSLFSCTMIFPFFSPHPPQFYADVLLPFLLRLFVLPCRAMQPLSLHLCYHLFLCHLRHLLFFLVLPLPSPLPPLRN